jgi:hypothetical protein
MSTSYPNSFPLSEIQTIISLYRSGTIQDNLDEFAHCVWVVQGYGQKALLGSPSSVSTQSLTDVSDEFCIQALESIVQDNPTTQMAIPWTILIPFFLRQLEKWLSKGKGQDQA